MQMNQSSEMENGPEMFNSPYGIDNLNQTEQPIAQDN